MKEEPNELRILPDPIPEITPEEIAQDFMRKPPKKEWRFMKKSGKKKETETLR